ncbi:MAG: hypothetical protein WC211_00575 [Dehalococcoidia bacterium]
MRNEWVLALIIGALGLSTCADCRVPAEAQVPARLAAGSSREAAAVTLARFVAGESDGRKPRLDCAICRVTVAYWWGRERP